MVLTYNGDIESITSSDEEMALLEDGNSDEKRTSSGLYFVQPDCGGLIHTKGSIYST